MIITFSGTHGAGKTTAAKALAKHLGYTYYSVGDVMREIASERNVTIKELADMLSSEPELDQEIDARTKALADKKDLVVDARMGWFFLPDSHKVFITAPLSARAKRTFSDPRKGDGFTSVADAAKQLEARQTQITKNLSALYGVNPYDPKNFDLVINTENYSVTQVVDKIISYL